jgi:hypothetical protein
MSEPTNPVKLFSELLGGPLGELISSVGQGVGDAQAALDQGALQQTLELYDLSKDGDRTDEELKLINLIRGMGYQPTFYAIPETEVEAQISLSLDLKSEQSSPIAGYALSKYKINATPLNAGNVNRFGLQADAMAKLKFKIVPVPPNANLGELRIVPDFSSKNWNDETKELIQNLGFTYELRTGNGVSITWQVPLAAAIANISNTTLVLKFSEICIIPELITKNWNEETKGMLQDRGINYELRAPDGTLITDEETAEGFPITSQNIGPETFVNTTSTVLVLTVSI